MRVCIYSAVGEARQLQPIKRSGFGLLKNRGRRTLDLAAWKLLGRRSIKYWAYEDLANSNVGDIAIRLALQEILREVYGSGTEFVSLQWGDLSSAAIDQINASCDLFVIGGSGYLHFEVDGQLSGRVFADLAHLERLKMPVVTAGIGANITGLSRDKVDGFRCDEKAAKAVRRLTEICCALSVRDKLSQRVVAAHTAKPVHVVPDPALLLKSGGEASGRKAADGLRCGVNFGLHGPYSAAILERNMPLYMKLLEFLVRDRKMAISYFVHSDAEKIIPRMLAMKGVKTDVLMGAPQHLLQGYKDLDVHICQMLHSSILAFNAGVPVLNLGYDAKNVGFLQHFGLERYSLPINELSFERIVAALDDILSHRAEIRQAIRAGKRNLSGQMMRFVAGIDDAARLQKTDRALG